MYVSVENKPIINIYECDQKIFKQYILNIDTDNVIEVDRFFIA